MPQYRSAPEVSEVNVLFLRGNKSLVRPQKTAVEDLSHETYKRFDQITNYSQQP